MNIVDNQPLFASTTSPLGRAKEHLLIPELWHRLGLPGTPSKSCRSPFREDRSSSFSVSSDGTLWNDFGEGAGGDAVDFYARAAGLDKSEAARRFIELAGTNTPLTASVTRKTYPKPERKFRPLPDLLPWKLSDSITLARFRRWPFFAGLEIAAARGLLGTVQLKDGNGSPLRCWAITDNRRSVLQARRLDGEPFGHRWNGNDRIWTPCTSFKAKTLCADTNGASWPVGAAAMRPDRAVILCEGAPDFLACFGLSWLASLSDCLDVVGLLGAANDIAEDALPLFTGKRVRIFMQDDSAGTNSAARWGAQLKRAAAAVDSVCASGDGVADASDALAKIDTEDPTDQQHVAAMFNGLGKVAA